MEKERILFARGSLAKYELYQDDPYIAFFALWTSLNAMYASGQPEGKEEWRKIEEFFNGSQVISAVSRTGLRDVFVIIAQEPQHRRILGYLGKFTPDLIAYSRDEGVFNPDVLDAQLGKLLAKVRNNLFHGEKAWHQEPEERLVRAINPILRDTVNYFVRKFNQI